MKQLNVLFGLLILAVALPSCATRKTEDQASSEMPTEEGMAQVSDVRLEKSNNQSLIVIESDQELNYNVFKLNDPERIVIDVIDAQLSSDVPVNLEGAEEIAAVNIQTVEDSLSRLVRIEVELEGSFNYLAGIEGSNLVVRLIPSDSPMVSEEMESEEMEGEAGPTENEFVADQEFGDEIPLLPEPELEGDTDTEGEEFLSEASPELPEADLPTAQLPEAEALPLPAPIPLPEASESEETSDSVAEVEKEAEIVEEDMEKADREEPLPEALPSPTALEQEEEKEEKVVEAPQTDEPKQAASIEPENDERVVVEPDGPQLPPSIATQDIPTTEITEGTSLLGGMEGKVYTGKRVSLEFQDANIQDVIRLIADVSKLNIIISDEVKGNVTLKLVDVPWDQALDILLTSKGLDKVQHGNILRVAPIEKLKKEREIALANDKAAKQLEPLQLKLFNVNYATASEMAERIQPLLSERGSVDEDSRTNTLIVEDIPEVLSRIDNLIRVLDTQTPQVRIESRIVQANDNFTRSLGIQWGPSLKLDGENGQDLDIQFPNTVNVLSSAAGSDAFTGPAPSQLSDFAVDALPGNEVTGGSFGFRLGSINNTFNLDLRLSYAENEQMARIVSRPSVTVLDNEEARIIQGSRIPFLSSSSEGSNVQFQEAGIEISVKPQITNDGAVILEVDTRSNEPGSEQVGGNPIILIREASTNMLVKSGRTAVLGGVFRTGETKGEGGVPGLKDIPLLGWLFKGKSRSSSREELLIFITPYILTDTREAQLAPSSSSPSDPF